ncbi:Radical SAM heme biosynthesis protein AhbD, Fe-coproporphyrin III decarboxylase [hydrothermal vent metagenome]|uniref:Radical SAM heme biosynthesis protein AhbD, Fe-coproporphyrin III decarboxylase n=1 Tax=hydrothermal vent metagenome TaxID=652676 RepID=A0A3B0TDA2_9ZZZZ
MRAGPDFGFQGAFHGHKTMTVPAQSPYLIALNLTERCNLSCEHCYLDAKVLKDGACDELTTVELKQLLGQIAQVGPEAMVVLTGGEPLLRKDIEELATHATSLGLMVVVGSNGILLSPARIEKLQEAGVAGVGLSIDSLDPERHDAFRGRKGAWSKTMAAIDACVAAGMPFQVHFSVTDETAGEIDAMVGFARDAGAMVLNVFFMVCTGRGEKYSDLSPAKYEEVLGRVAHAARSEKKLMVRAKCAPHFKRIAMEMDPAWPITSAHGYDAGGCIAATRYARVTPNGQVTPCPYMENSVGSVRDTSFAQIWNTAPTLQALRAPKLEGRCGICEFQKLCGGCRARPLARSGNMMGEDFLCSYQPQGGAIIDPIGPVSSSMKWTEDAETHIARVPGFVRRMVRHRAEDFVRGQGRNEVTSDDLTLLAKRRFGDAGPPKFVQMMRANRANGGGDT